MYFRIGEGENVQFADLGPLNDLLLLRSSSFLWESFQQALHCQDFLGFCFKVVWASEGWLGLDGGRRAVSVPWTL